jgi:hypothetical protein
MVRLDTGTRQLINGSWGGANMFAPRNPVDLDAQDYAIPPNGVVIKGERGHGGTSATLYVPLTEASRFLPTESPKLAPSERHALYCYRAIKSGPYRRDELERRGVLTATIDELVTRGLLARNKVGAVMITTAGRNAVGDWAGF